MPSKTRYAIVGVGSRSGFFYSAIAHDFASTAEVVALCDPNQTRMDLANRRLVDEFGYAAPVRTYKAPAGFDAMVAEARPDVVIVTSVDRTHDHYIVRALELGLRVVTEKPMAVDAARCARVLRCVADTGGELRVAFNYRYAPVAARVRELLRAGEVGTVASVHFEWLLNTSHGADYFRRWHRDKRNSGGLLVHKATHHFDLVNFWLGTRPRTVYARGGLRVLRPRERRGARRRQVLRARDGRGRGRGGGRPVRAGHGQEREAQGAVPRRRARGRVPARPERVRRRHLHRGHDERHGHVRQRRRRRAYSLTAYAPWEGYRVAFNGTAGRLEVEVVENSYVSAGGEQAAEGALRSKSILLRRHFERPVEVAVPEARGGHGGGDVALLNDLFGERKEEHSHMAAGPRRRSHVDSDGHRGRIKSIATGLPVDVDDLLNIRCRARLQMKCVIARTGCQRNQAMNSGDSHGGCASLPAVTFVLGIISATPAGPNPNNMH